MIDGFANIGRHGNSARAIANVREAVKGRRAIIGLAEIDEADGPDEHRILRHEFNGWHSAAFNTRVPILDNVSSWWKRTGAIKVLGHPGIDRVSPGRLIVGVKYRNRVTGRKRARLNSHVVAGAFNAKHEHNDPLRRRYWEQWWSTLRVEVRQLVDDGYDVVVSFDGNRQRPPLPIHQLHPRAVMVMHQATDYLIAVPAAGHVVEVDRVWSVPLGVDFHRGLFAQVRFTKRGRPIR